MGTEPDLCPVEPAAQSCAPGPWPEVSAARPFLSPQLRQLVNVCINPDPEKRPDVTYVYDVAKRVHASTASA